MILSTILPCFLKIFNLMVTFLVIVWRLCTINLSLFCAKQRKFFLITIEVFFQQGMGNNFFQKLDFYDLI